MRRVFQVFVGLSFLLLSTIASGADSSAPRQLVRIEGLSTTQIDSIAGRGIEIAKAGRSYIEIVVGPEDLAALRLPSMGIKQQVLVPDLDAQTRDILHRQRRGAEYYMYDRLVSTLNQWASQYSAIARLYSIGKTYEGRDILAMKVSDNPDADEQEPAALIDGSHHAREWISTEVPMAALQQLLEGYGRDQRLTQLVNTREIWFVPVVNPDGVVYSQTKEKYWRKNRRPIDAKNVGVDINRNYGFQWGNLGASNDPAQDTYAGSNAFSEPETQAIKGLCEREHFQTALSFHSYSELVLYPYSYAKGVVNPLKRVFQELAQGMTAFNGYTPENSADLYAASGTLDDWLFGVLKTLALTIELERVYAPPPEKIAEVCRLNVPTVFYMIEQAGRQGLLVPDSSFEVSNLADADTCLEAIAESPSIKREIPAVSDMRTDDRVRALGVRLSELAASLGETDRATIEQAIRTVPAAGFVLPLIELRRSFGALHKE